MTSAAQGSSRTASAGLRPPMCDGEAKLARRGLKGRRACAYIAVLSQVSFVPLSFVPLSFVPLSFVPLSFVPLSFVQVGLAQGVEDAPRSENGTPQTGAPDLLRLVAAEEPEPNPNDVSQWLAELDSDRYAVREAAQHRLHQAGGAALAGVGEVAQSRASLESSWRAVNILLEWSKSGDASLRLEALEHIAQLVDYPHEASQAKEQLGAIRERIAIEAIKKSGGRVQSVRSTGGSYEDGPLHVIVGPEWTGGIEGLRQIRDVRRAKIVSLWSAPLGDEAALEVAKGLRGTNVERVEFYGLKLSENAIAEAGAEMPGIQLEVHRGNARLGIASAAVGQGVAGVPVESIVPNSAAEKAGLRLNDVITHIDAERVADFRQLTQLIGAHSGGDEIELTVERGQAGTQTLKLKAKLDSWGADDPSPSDVQNLGRGRRGIPNVPAMRRGRPIPPGFPIPRQPGQP